MVRRWFGAGVAVACLVACGPAFADSGGSGTHEEAQGRVLLPYAFYTPETGVAGGFATIWTFRGALQAADGRPSVLRTGATYTVKNQLVLQVAPEVYLAEGRFLVGGELLFKDFPDKYWGIGPGTSEVAEEDFTLLTRRAEVFAQREFGAFRMRVLGVAESARLKEFQQGGLLDGPVTPGVEAGRVAGIGAGAGYDTRDDLFAPGRGSWHQVKAVWFREGLGGDYDFTVVEADLRTFLPIGRSVLGLHGLARDVSGAPPFYYLSPLGGQNMLRGVYEGRFRDNALLVAQAELRTPLGGRWGLAAFAAAGTVAPRPADLDAGEIKTAAGVGLRFQLDRRERINARLDVAAGKEGVNVYLALMEAF